MKKKCRVYGTGGAYSYKMQTGGSKPVMTQDSENQDDVPQQKTASFVNKLHENHMKAMIEQEIEQEKQSLLMKCGGKVKHMQTGGPYFPGNTFDPDYYAQLGYGQLPDYIDAPKMQNPEVFNVNKKSDLKPFIEELQEEGLGRMKHRSAGDIVGRMDKMDHIPAPLIENSPMPGDMEISQPDMYKEDKPDGWMTTAMITSGAMRGLDFASMIAQRIKEAKQQQELTDQITDVHNIFGTKDRMDRGDYMVNTPGVGDFLRPNQHTRIGYGTKVAQEGMEIGDEIELTEEEINKLIQEGYDLEYLD